MSDHVTVIGIITHLSRKSDEIAGLKILPESGGEAFWVNQGEFKAMIPEGIAKEVRVEVTYSDYGKKKFLEGVKVLDGGHPAHQSRGERSTPSPSPPSGTPRTIQAAVKQPPTGPDPAALRLYARAMALDLAQREKQYNLPDEYTAEDVIKASRPYENHLLSAVAEAIKALPPKEPACETPQSLMQDPVGGSLSRSIMHEMREEADPR